MCTASVKRVMDGESVRVEVHGNLALWPDVTNECKPLFDDRRTALERALAGAWPRLAHEVPFSNYSDGRFDEMKQRVSKSWAKALASSSVSGELEMECSAKAVVMAAETSGRKSSMTWPTSCDGAPPLQCLGRGVRCGCGSERGGGVRALCAPGTGAASAMGV